MADVRAFRAYRYDLGRVGSLSDVVAPPYDVIDPPLQEALFARSRYNVLHVDLTRDQPGDNDHHNRYTRAAATLRDWLNDGILVQDSARSLYAYEQEYQADNGATYTRRGFLARVRLEPFGQGRIYPHEQTLAGPKADRLSLYRATRMNLSPVFGLYPDPEGSVYAPLAEYTRRHLPLEATDHLGVKSRLWPVTDPTIITAVTASMGPRPIFIADGHHRYETGLKYAQEQEALGQVQGEDAPQRFILMMLVSMSDPGLLIMPTHRLVSGLGRPTAATLAERLRGYFQLEHVGTGPAAARQTWELMQADGTQAVLGFGTVADDTWQLARLTRPEAMTELAPQQSPAWRELAVSVLHRLVLETLLAPAPAPGASAALTPAPKCRYVHLLDEVQQARTAAECELAVLVPPATMQHVERIAGNWETMPPKSTYFYPKLLSGLVFNSLHQH